MGFFRPGLRTRFLKIFRAGLRIRFLIVRFVGFLIVRFVVGRIMSFEGIDFNDDTAAAEAIKSLVHGMKSLKDVCYDLVGMLYNGYLNCIDC